MTDKELLEAIRAIVKEEVQAETNKTNMLIENQVWPAIQKLAEGHQLILERIDEKITDRTEDLQEQIEVLNAVVKRHSREIQQLKKAQ